MLTEPTHRSQHDKAHRRYLEMKRSRLVRELRRVNEELRQRAPVVRDKADNDDWDFDPRQLGTEAAK